MSVDVTVTKDFASQLADIEDAALLWGMWASERGLKDPDTDYYIQDLVTKLQTERYTVAIARDEAGIAMGMVDVMLDYDPSERRIVAYIDKLFVPKQFRGGTIARKLTEAAEFLARIQMADIIQILVKEDGPMRYYKRRGFVHEMHFMQAEVT